MEYVQMTLNDWIQMKQKLRQELQGVTRSFVRIGYALRKIEDGKFYEQDGYKSIVEFAKAEYGLQASTVSRFMAINREYSIDGYSEHLRTEYAELGRSQLEEMLQLPEADRQMVGPETSREDIRELKRFNKSEPVPGEADDIPKLIRSFFYMNPDELDSIFRELGGGADLDNLNWLTELINPSGSRVYKKGLYFMAMGEDCIKIKRFGSDPEKMSWEEFLRITVSIFGETARRSKHVWKEYFGEEQEGEKEKTEEPGKPDPKREPKIQGEGIGEEIPKEGKKQKNEEQGSAGGNETTDTEIQRTGEPEEKGTAGEKTEELKPDPKGTGERPEEALNQPEEEIAPAQNRKDYMNFLTLKGMADYLAKEYRERRLRVDMLGFPEKLEDWLKGKVKEDGSPKEEE